MAAEAGPAAIAAIAAEDWMKPRRVKPMCPSPKRRRRVAQTGAKGSILAAAAIPPGRRSSMRPAPLAAFLALLLLAPATAEQTVWRFDSLTSVGGMTPKLEGHPALVDSPLGKAVAFNGKDDAMFLPGRPLVGAKTF